MIENDSPGCGYAAAPAASVIVAAYQAAGFVQDAVRSALAQTRRDIEVVVVDDGSSDGTWDAILACASEDARLVPVRQPRRAGPAAARNAAIARARGRWLAVLDADDLYMPRRLEHMIAAAEASGADLLADNMLRVDFTTGTQFGVRFSNSAMNLGEPVTLAEAVRRDMPGGKPRDDGLFGFLQPIIRREFLLSHGIRYAEDVQVGEDFLLYIECIARGGRFHLMPAAHYVQRVRGDSHSRGRDAMLHLSAANRRMVRLAVRERDREAAALLHRRQRLIDIDCFARLLDEGQILAALKHAHLGGPARLLRHVRAAAGAVRRRFKGLPPALPGLSTPIQGMDDAVPQRAPGLEKGAAPRSGVAIRAARRTPVRT
ncbi:MAG: glycosyltransferase family 2 protein [Acetobacteraceae bacterium]|nr:glycosyltransferase family 2 protein [Acetobacteraceae bacterium]